LQSRRRTARQRVAWSPGPLGWGRGTDRWAEPNLSARKDDKGKQGSGVAHTDAAAGVGWLVGGHPASGAGQAMVALLLE
jgi:hypothetical protein